MLSCLELKPVQYAQVKELSACHCLGTESFSVLQYQMGPKGATCPRQKQDRRFFSFNIKCHEYSIGASRRVYNRKNMCNYRVQLQHCTTSDREIF